MSRHPPGPDVDSLGIDLWSEKQLRIIQCCEDRALQKSRRQCNFSPQRVHVAYLELRVHTAVVVVARCLALDWAMTDDRKRCVVSVTSGSGPTFLSVCRQTCKR